MECEVRPARRKVIERNDVPRILRRRKKIKIARIVRLSSGVSDVERVRILTEMVQSTAHLNRLEPITLFLPPYCNSVERENVAFRSRVADSELPGPQTVRLLRKRSFLLGSAAGHLDSWIP